MYQGANDLTDDSMCCFNDTVGCGCVRGFVDLRDAGVVNVELEFVVVKFGALVMRGLGYELFEKVEDSVTWSNGTTSTWAWNPPADQHSSDQYYAADQDQYQHDDYMQHY
jgi:hypothetical protein